MSSDDSPPLGQRRRPLGSAAIGIQGSSDDELPEWAATYKSPYTGGLRPHVSSSDDEKDKPSSTAEEKKKGVGEASAPSPGKGGPLSAPQEGRPAQDPDGAKPEPSSQPDFQRREHEESRTGKPPDLKGRTGAKVAELPDKASQPSTSKQAATHTKAGKLESEGNECGDAPSGSSKPAGDKKDVTITLPDKLPRNKVLAELCPGEDDQLVDLAGDAGAVGRMIVTGEQGSGQLQVDLKGGLFNATVLPLAGTAMVVNIGPSEAKVEALVNDYLWLHPVEGLCDDEDGGYGKDLMVSDDEDYQPEQAGEGAQATEAKGSKKKDKKPAKDKAGVAKKPRGAAVQGGGVRKKSGAPKTAPKKPAGSAAKAKPKK